MVSEEEAFASILRYPRPILIYCADRKSDGATGYFKSIEAIPFDFRYQECCAIDVCKLVESGESIDSFLIKMNAHWV